MFIIAVTFTFHERHRDEFRRAILANAATSLKEEDGCIVFDVCESQDRPVFFLYEQYADEEAFGLHFASPHFIDFDRESASWVSKKTVERFMLLPRTLRSQDIFGHGR